VCGEYNQGINRTKICGSYSQWPCVHCSD